jgi:hypothetical protein
MNEDRRGKREGRESCCPITSSTERRREADTLAASVKASLPPGLAQPALRALASAGFTSLDQFTRVRAENLLKLHGMGPKAVGIIREALRRRGQAFLS